MSFFAQLGKPMINGTVTLTSGSLSATLYTPSSTNWTDVYSIEITTNDTATQTVTVSDGTTSLAYLVGGGSPNLPVIDQASIPVRFKKGTAITVTASAVTSAKSIIVNIRGLTSAT